MLRIATVDDNPADLKEIRMCLSHYFQKRSGQTPIDYTISAYTSGPSFLENFEKGDYDLILLDIYMPRMTGMQVAERSVPSMRTHGSSSSPPAATTHSKATTSSPPATC